MIVLAIDPGTTSSGWLLFDGQQVLDSGVYQNHEVLDRLIGSLAFGRADMLAIEMIASYGMPVGREVFETCVWIGRFVQAWRHPDEVRRVNRLEVKMHICHTARAKDANIWAALCDRFGPPGTKAQPGTLYGVRSHARAALALAVTVSDQLRARQPSDQLEAGLAKSIDLMEALKASLRGKDPVAASRR